MAERWFAYLVSCRDGSLYAGITNDLAKRLEAHNSGRGARYTRSRRPVELVWKRRVIGKGNALSVEARVKALTKREKLLLISRASASRGLLKRS